MTTTEQILTIGLMAAAVVLTRFLPFLAFPSEERTPRFVRFLGRFLASAVFGMLVIYCLKDVSFTTGNHGWPELLAIAVTCLLHVWRKNMLLTIAGGTACYMLIVHFL